MPQFFHASLAMKLILYIYKFSFLNSSRLILTSINAWDIKVPMLFILLLASITILLYFFFFLVILNNFFNIALIKEDTRVKLALAIPAEDSITVAKEIIDPPPLVAVKKNYSLVKIIKNSNVFTKCFTYYFSFLNFRIYLFCVWSYLFHLIWNLITQIRGINCFIHLWNNSGLYCHFL